MIGAQSVKLLTSFFIILFSLNTFALTDKQLKDYRKIAVTITPADEPHHGGTGSVIRSSRDGSLILTNKHVCGVVKEGGAVHKDGETYKVKLYKEYGLHDLCLIYVEENLKTQVTISSQAPQPGDKSYVTGFPLLQPNIVTEGHFSDLTQIEVMIGVRDCTDKENMDDPMGCAFFGKAITQRYKTQFTSNLIQPGNSGSAVLNSNGELAGVVFAGGGDLAFGYIVPYSSVVHFLATLDYWHWQKPKHVKKKVKTAADELDQKCSSVAFPNKKIKDLCDSFTRDYLVK